MKIRHTFKPPGWIAQNENTTYLQAPWLDSPNLQRLFAVLTARGATARVVGGAVRDALRKIEVKDIDLAINVAPAETISLLEAADITAIPTGIEYGTITAVIEKTPYQITTLRKDVKTFGRKADVEFTEDWIEDAKRRDFTINAIYTDADGKIYDPCGGLEDLEAKRVQFIGAPKERIKEDYLRILRFFRFTGLFIEWSGDGHFDKEGLAACHKYADKLPTLSKERITEEFFKILGSNNSHKLLKEMKPELEEIFSAFYESDFKILSEVERFHSGYDFPCAHLLHLALIAKDSDSIKLLRLSNEQNKKLKLLMDLREEIVDDVWRWLYYYGREITEAILLVNVGNQTITEDEYVDCVAVIEGWERPSFPLKGEDLMDLGIPRGKLLGDILKQTEKWWVLRRFKPNRAECLEQAKAIYKS